MAKRDDDNDFEFRIIAGELKGKLIRAPKLAGTRPPLSRMRKSIFDFLNPYLIGANYLDLFSGTGSYLFEAVSRGVDQATGVELDERLVESINHHAEQFGVADRLLCLQADVFEAISDFAVTGRLFDIVMIAPPQYRGVIDQTMQALADHRIVRDDALILCQHDTSETSKINFGSWPILQQRKYGNTTYTILSPSEPK
ncbi:MAG TPA: RsmD family RNA methyltransferase [candidate division Zixibacteria bacterium]|nr:RsmD family RNA methyltransferase [candidate division Zixibacteria bacterium]